ncbi:MAG: hypothetical protein QOE85_276, partial [Actinomycetota bacterium]|nr:hypothetical protein [Actinomycetota bacterium]
LGDAVETDTALTSTRSPKTREA